MKNLMISLYVIGIITAVNVLPVLARGGGGAGGGSY